MIREKLKKDIQAALLEPRTAQPQTTLQRALGALWGWC